MLLTQAMSADQHFGDGLASRAFDLPGVARYRIDDWLGIPMDPGADDSIREKHFDRVAKITGGSGSLVFEGKASHWTLPGFFIVLP
jgi:hypothetical protein